jgi:predicted RNase H-like HicB family nuclease
LQPPRPLWLDEVGEGGVVATIEGTVQRVADGSLCGFADAATLVRNWNARDVTYAVFRGAKFGDVPGGMRFTAAVSHAGDWQVARCLEVDVASQGHTVEEALANLREALELYFEDETIPDGLEPPIIATVELSA